MNGIRRDGPEVLSGRDGAGLRGRGRWHGVVLFVVVPWWSGCYSPPRRASQMMGNPPAGAVGPEGSVPVEETGFWVPGRTHTCELEPSAVLARGCRVVVTEFNVEFVDYQFQLPAPRQPMIKPPPVSPNPVSLAMRAIGVGRRSSWLADEEQQALAADLYNAFLEELHRRGLETVSQDELHASAAYAGLRRKPEVRSSPLMVFNPVGSDMGTVLHTRTVPAPGLCVVRAAGCARATAEARILQETRANVALAVRLRVGTFREQPALEHRSVIRLTTCEGSTTLRARHSLVSDATAVAGARFRPIVGRIEPLDAGAFSHELTAMLPRFVALAFAAPNS